MKNSRRSVDSFSPEMTTRANFSATQGTGEETVRTGHVTARTTCSYCDGTRIFVKYKCHECEGIGRKTYESPVELNIPPGDQTLLGNIGYYVIRF